MEKIKKHALIRGGTALIVSVGVIIGLSLSFGILPALGNLFLPGNGVWNVQGNLPKYKEFTDPGLDDEVRIYRDEWGIPHIYGHGEPDLFFALGFCHAQDRMFQMDMMRRTANGQMAAFLGPDSIEDDKFNLLKMTYHYAKLTRIDMETSLDPEIQQMFHLLTRYVAGINKYISENQKNKPFEYQFLNAEIAPWELEDTLVYAGFISEYFTWGYDDFRRFNNLQFIGTTNYTELYGFPFPYQLPVCPNYGEYDDISRPPSQFNIPESSLANASFIPQTQANLEFDANQDDLPESGLRNYDIPNLDFFNDFISGISRFPQEKERLSPDYIKGSNNWVVAGNKTASGKPLLCSDMHLGWTLPGLWYESHLIDLDSDLNLYAINLAGVPLPVAGHTEYVGWGETIGPFDLLDWYYYNGINETHYEYKGEAVSYETIDVSISVKGEDDVPFTIKSTVHGPVFTDLIDIPSNFSENVIACKWVAQNITYDYLALYGYMHATDVYEFDTYSEYFSCLPLSIAFGDTSGNIGIRPNAKIPIRNDTDLEPWHVGNGRMPYNGSKGEGEWIGYVPFEDRPFCINPEQGYLTSANQYIAGPDYPNIEKINAGGADGLRARRINQVLAAGTELTVDDMKDLQLDIFSVRARNMTPYILDALDAVVVPFDLQSEAYAELDSWNYKMEGDSAAASIFNIWFEAYMFLTFDDDREILGEFRSPSWSRLEQLTYEFPNSHWFDDITTSPIEARDDIIVQAFGITLDALEEYYATDDIAQWKWSVIHQLEFPHFAYIPGLGLGPYPGSGASATVNPSYTRNLINGAVVPGASRAGPSERIIVDFGDMNNSRSVLPAGESGISSSPHYADQLELFLRGEYHVQYFSSITSSILESQANIESLTVFKKGGSYFA